MLVADYPTPDLGVTWRDCVESRPDLAGLCDAHFEPVRPTAIGLRVHMGCDADPVEVAAEPSGTCGLRLQTAELFAWGDQAHCAPGAPIEDLVRRDLDANTTVGLAMRSKMVLERFAAPLDGTLCPAEAMGALVEARRGGTIHATDSVLPALIRDGLVSFDSGRPVGPQGQPVVVGPGYSSAGPGGATGSWLFITGPVMYGVGDITGEWFAPSVAGAQENATPRYRASRSAQVLIDVIGAAAVQVEVC